MFADPQNPFAAASKNGGVPGPFQPASPGEVKSPFSPQQRSPFEAASSRPDTSQIPPLPMDRNSASPFAMAPKAPEPEPSVPKLAESFEGFTVADAKPSESSDGWREVDRSEFTIPAEHPAPRTPQARELQEAAPVKTAVDASPVHGDMPQLVLRAIFGVSKELNREEILQLSRALPGVEKLDLVSSAEAGAMALLRKSIRRLGFSDAEAFRFGNDQGELEIIEDSGSAMAVFHQGSYAPGVRETLILVSRELARLE